MISVTATEMSPHPPVSAAVRVATGMRRPFSIAATALALVAAAAPAAAAQSAPNDPYFDLQWGQEQIRTPAAWARSTGAGTTIAIVDSGVDLDHPDLAGKIAGG